MLVRDALQKIRDYDLDNFQYALLQMQTHGHLKSLVNEMQPD